jgi:magnesium-transporting ATPase (P-type)
LKDNVIVPLLSEEGKIFKDDTYNELEKFANQGFRTLVLAYKNIKKEEYEVIIHSFTGLFL